MAVNRVIIGYYYLGIIIVTMSVDLDITLSILCV